MTSSRRQFLAQSSAAALFGATQESPKNPSIKMGLYSITYAGLWYRGRALTLEEVVDRAQKFGYQGVEVGGKRPHGFPPDMPKSRCQKLRKYATDKGIELFAVAGNNDFSSPIAEHREAQIVYLRELMRMTSDLGVKTLRVFLGWPGATKIEGQGGSYELARKVFEVEHQGYSPEQIWGWCRDGLKESARYAREYGVTLALQNHKPVIKDYRDVLKMVREVDSPNLKVVLDAPLMDEKDEASIRKAAFEVGSLQVTSHFGGEYSRGSDGKVSAKDSGIYAPFVRAMMDIGYRGYISYELCHKLPVVNGNTVGIEYAEKNAELAAEFMRGVIADAAKAPRKSVA